MTTPGRSVSKAARKALDTSDEPWDDNLEGSPASGAAHGGNFSMKASLTIKLDGDASGSDVSVHGSMTGTLHSPARAASPRQLLLHATLMAASTDSPAGADMPHCSNCGAVSPCPCVRAQLRGARGSADPAASPMRALPQPLTPLTATRTTAASAADAKFANMPVTARKVAAGSNPGTPGSTQRGRRGSADPVVEQLGNRAKTWWPLSSQRPAAGSTPNASGTVSSTILSHAQHGSDAAAAETRSNAVGAATQPRALNRQASRTPAAGGRVTIDSDESDSDEQTTTTAVTNSAAHRTPRSSLGANSTPAVARPAVRHPASVRRQQSQQANRASPVAQPSVTIDSDDDSDSDDRSQAKGAGSAAHESKGVRPRTSAPSAVAPSRLTTGSIVSGSASTNAQRMRQATGQQRDRPASAAPQRPTVRTAQRPASASRSQRPTTSPRSLVTSSSSSEDESAAARHATPGSVVSNASKNGRPTRTPASTVTTGKPPATAANAAGSETTSSDDATSRSQSSLQQASRRSASVGRADGRGSAAAKRMSSATEQQAAVDAAVARASARISAARTQAYARTGAAGVESVVAQRPARRSASDDGSSGGGGSDDSEAAAGRGRAGRRSSAMPFDAGMDGSLTISSSQQLPHRHSEQAGLSSAASFTGSSSAAEVLAGAWTAVYRGDASQARLSTQPGEFAGGSREMQGCASGIIASQAFPRVACRSVY